MIIDQDTDRYYFGDKSAGNVLENIMNCKSNNYIKKKLIVKAYKSPRKFVLQTKEGQLKGEEGDYIIIGFNNEIYISKKEVFENTYIKI
jgi:hypothetical protein